MGHAEKDPLEIFYGRIGEMGLDEDDLSSKSIKQLGLLPLMSSLDRDIMKEATAKPMNRMVVRKYMQQRLRSDNNQGYHNISRTEFGPLVGRQKNISVGIMENKPAENARGGEIKEG